MNSVKFKIGTGIILIFISLSACERNEPEDAIIIKTGDIEVFAGSTYIFRGTIVSMGEAEITEHGFCWSESENPVIDENSVCLGARSSTGIFNCTVSDLSTNTTYYVTAFAIAGSNTYYGEERSFTTPETFPLIVIDIDHNIYSTVEIGNQIWMAENFKATRYSDGSVISRVEDRLTWYNFALYTSAYCWYENYGAIGASYGALYTWPAAMRVNSASEIKPGKIQGVCPDGWHLPDDDEWKQLEIYLGMNQPDADAEGWRGTDEGGRIKNKGTRQWQSPNTGATNESGFTALPAGWRDGAGYFKNLGTATRFWSSSKRGDYGWVRQLDYNSSQIFRGTKGLYEAISVRCIKDE
ncbi:MAG: hypothetical protein A2Z69_01155 [Bacteroidetes bacterium RBG_13_44_24]|nr:MAG: hypothetical protein A2Z69_01155 [Bacteroidetes bacterium RBG_13_44_24]